VPIPRFTRDNTALLVVDLQEKLLPVIHESDRLIQQAAKLISGCRILRLPIYATEQYPQGLGPTIGPIAQLLADAPIHSKLTFSSALQPIITQLHQSGRTHVLICGIEAHVCVLQTAFDLAAADLVAAVVTDAVSSRRPADRSAALDRMIQGGIVPVSVEMALLEILGQAGSDDFKAILRLIK
jgi:nicotinamidase-related amidase